MLSGKKILIGITGSIAAYKIPILVRLLVKDGAEVKVLMTDAARNFVSPLTLSTLSKNEVLKDLFEDDAWTNHVALGRWADLFLVAPLSCNTLSKMANGACDNLLLATYLSATCPVWVAPAMDEDMWKHGATKRNLSLLEKDGCTVLPVAHGELASGLVGEGRMSEPEAILEEVRRFFLKSEKLAGKNILVTAGPTYEAIDPVRFIGNHSSGKMGMALAQSLHQAGGRVKLVCGPVHGITVPPGVQVQQVTSADEMYEACMADHYDIAVMAAAVADYKPRSSATAKLKKSEGEMELALVKTPDILKSLGERKTNGQLLIGFALETDSEEKHALKKLREKNADMIVLNSLQDAGAGFGHDTNKITIYYKNGQQKAFPLKSKSQVANDIVEAITELLP